ncbi:phasin family protein [Methylobacterium sp. sgz302541]|uniref:phasin family protein n=1 Tax=unclassified Methylobacterium TaxID=2615210 RepID=UPI003D351DB5
MTRPIATTADPMKAAGAGMQAMLKSAGSAARVSQAIGIEWVYFVRQSVEQSTAAAKTLAKADSLPKVLEIQAEYAKGSYERFVAQAATFQDLFTGLAAEMAKPFQMASARAA